jgi:hypothetical protein
MRNLWLISVLVMGCGKKAEEPPKQGSSNPPPATTVDAAAAAGSGSDMAGSGSGSAVAGAPCVKHDPDTQLAAFDHVDDKSVTFCVDLKDKRDCYVVDIASGAMTASKPPPLHPKPAFHVEQDNKEAKLCKGDATGAACTKLDLAPLKGDRENLIWDIAIKADGSQVAAIGGGELVILDGAGKKLKTAKVVRGDQQCPGHPSYMGDAIYVPVGVCAGPGAEGFVYDATAKQVGNIKEVNVFGAEPVLVDGTTWAIAGFGGGDYAEYDTKTNKVTRTVKVDRPADCGEECDLFGDAATAGTTPLIKVGDKLVLIGAVIAVTDPASGKVEKSIKIPACK